MPNPDFDMPDAPSGQELVLKEKENADYERCTRGPECVRRGPDDPYNPWRPFCLRCGQTPRPCMLKDFHHRNAMLPPPLCTGETIFCTSCAAKHTWWQMVEAGGNEQSVLAVAGHFGQKLWDYTELMEENKENPHFREHMCSSMFPLELGSWKPRLWNRLGELDRPLGLRSNVQSESCDFVPLRMGLCSQCEASVRDFELKGREFFNVVDGHLRRSVRR